MASLAVAGSEISATEAFCRMEQMAAARPGYQFGNWLVMLDARHRTTDLGLALAWQIERSRRVSA